MSAWTEAHARRLLWRGGFGGTPKEIRYWTRRSRGETLDWLIRGGRGPHGTKRMVGHAPRIGRRLDPVNEYGDDVLWWLDQMVRSQRPLREKLTLFWHDHFATRDQDGPLMIAQNRTLRRHALGTFPALLKAVTLDPAMQSFLSLVDSNKDSPNENFARELMELFTLGVDGGYTERDVRAAARALTGFAGNYREGKPLTIHYDRERHDAGNKKLLGSRGRLDWHDVLRIVVRHRSHAPFLVGQLWDYFVAEPLPAATRRRLARGYVASGRRIAPLVREILDHPAIYADLDAPPMVKWPVVQLAGQLRAIRRGIDTDSWTYISAGMGQLLFHPPSVAGWDTGPAWMSTSTSRGRFQLASELCREKPLKVEEKAVDVKWTWRDHIARARKATGDPWTGRATDRELRRMAREFLRPEGRAGAELQPFQAVIAQSALRHLLLSCPDAALC
jgi:uncharacterized protein (DUF1800 family)